ncbi:MAG: N-acetylmuramoyl-L-alanine amidase, partial [Ignavibacteriaceae bacterium]|nr:N-acetylmuramoyl-L-alanine amidase [Ignavibacteriaceae bacterium]
MKQFLFFCILLLCGSQHFSQSYSTVEIKFGLEKKSVRALERRGALYISVRDFAAKFKTGHYYSEVNKKSELKFKESVIKFTAKNPFVVITQTGSKVTAVYQMTLSTLFFGEDIFVESESFRKYLGKAQLKMLSYTGKPVPVKETKKETVTPPSAEGSVRFNYSQRANGSVLRIGTESEFNSYRHTLKGKLLTIELEKTAGIKENVSQSYSDGILDSISASNISGGIRIRILAGKSFDAYDIIKNSNKSLTVSFRKKEETITPTDLSDKKKKWKFDVVVIDPGHGGKDMGAVGANKTIEKNINLAVGLKLGKLINKYLPEVKVVYTRKTDTFIELHKRGKIANDAGGKLFISIHCNSVAGKKKAPNGTEVYLLRPGKTQDAIEIAEIENSVISYEEDPKKYKELTDENFILVSMAHASYMKYSEKFADLVDINFRNKLDINSRGVKQAGFYVLVGAAMPGVLIETGFVSNDRDAAYIRSEEGQNDIASSILDAV